METSAHHQKQKRILSKPHRLARSIVGQFTSLSESPLKRVSIIGIGVLAGVGVPAIVFASQQQTAPRKMQSTAPSTATSQNAAPSTDEGAASLSASITHTTSSAEDLSKNTSMTINGEKIATDNGSVSRQIVNSDGSEVNVDISIENTPSTTVSGTSTSSTHVYVDSSSSAVNGQNPVRGSPRR